MYSVHFASRRRLVADGENSQKSALFENLCQWLHISVNHIHLRCSAATQLREGVESFVATDTDSQKSQSTHGVFIPKPYTYTLQ